MSKDIFKYQLKEKEKEIAHEILKEENAIVDGIINIDQYIKAKYRILWVLKEPYSNIGGWNFQDYLSKRDIESKKGKKNDPLKKMIWKKIFYSTYGLLHLDIDYDNIPEVTDASVYGTGEQIAYINLKKTGGGSSSKYDIICDAYKRNEEILFDQIIAYDPNIIIFGNTLFYFDSSKMEKICWNINPSNKQYVDKMTGNTTYYVTSNERLCIHTNHPSYWKLTNKEYCSEILHSAKIWMEK